MSRPTDAGERGRTAAHARRDESLAFLEAASGHLRDAGYHVELDYDNEAGEAVLLVDGIEVRFVRSLPDEPLKH